MELKGEYVFDIETDGLLDTYTKMHILSAHNRISGKTRSFHGESIEHWLPYFKKAKKLIGHNIIGFDLIVLKELYDFVPHPDTEIVDTLIWSQILNYKRFGNKGHSLEVWAEAFNMKKPSIENWSELNDNIINRCETDLKINTKMYDKLLKEVAIIFEKKPTIKTYLKAEHRVSEWNALGSRHGWPFDLKAAKELHKKLDLVLEESKEKIIPILGMKCVPKDKKNGEVEVKSPKWTKKGYYNSHTAGWFGVDPISGLDDDDLNKLPFHRMIRGDYCRVEFKPLSLSSVADVKLFLFRHGWVPTDYNYKFEGRKKIKTSPKITEDSLELLKGHGQLYKRYTVAQSRYDILTGWLAKVDENSRLHGDVMNIGTPSMRSRHSVICNIPSPNAEWGPEFRNLFGSLPGWTLVGCDSVNNQARGLAHYLKNDEYTNELLHGDNHAKNAKILTNILRKMRVRAPKLYAEDENGEQVWTGKYGVSRPQAKRIIYAFLFGAGGGKLWSYIFGSSDDELGATLKEEFIKAVPGFEGLIKKLSIIYNKTKKDGFPNIPSIVGNKIYIDSPHKLLVYLLQCLEKITCACSCMVCMERLIEEEIPFIPLIMYHDEIDFMVPDEYADRASRIGAISFKEGPELVGVSIMDGSAKTGKTWLDIH